MIFTLEALEARYGDCLILHYETTGKAKAKPEFMVVDGGPDMVFANSLNPRLEGLKQRWYPEGRLPIRLLMVSHIDDDHVNGVLALTNLLVEKRNDGEALPYDILNLWHNSFDNVIGNESKDLFSQFNSSTRVADIQGIWAPNVPFDDDVAAVVASVGQGRELRENAKLLDIRLNQPFEGLVMAQANAKTSFEWQKGPTFTVLAPNITRLSKLHAEWEKALKEAKKKGDPSVISAAYSDQSVFNLSSIVVLVELGGKSILLTGDARGDDIIEGIEKAKLFKDGNFSVDILKLPHHGSDRNVSTDFFRTVLATNYVISADGTYDNPDMTTLEMISEARTDDNFSVHLTNGDGKKNLKKKLQNFLQAKDAKGRKYKVNVRNGPSIKIDLLSKVAY
jgi:hypothetical protein